MIARRVLAAALALAAASAAPAQWLNLDAPAPPVVHEDSALEALAASLADEARALERNEPAKAAFRRLAVSLLRAGAGRPGVGGDAPISGGVRIAHALPGLDALADAASDDATPEAVRAAIAVRLRAFTARAARFDASSVPDWPTLDVSLAALFGELAEAQALLDGRATRGAWPLDPRAQPAPSAEQVRTLITQAGWSAESIAALEPLLSSLDNADIAPALRPAADDTLTMLDRAAQAHAAVASRAWLAEPQSAEILADIEAAAALCADPDRRREGRARLESAVLLAEIAAAASDAADAGGDERLLRELLDACAARLSADALSDDDRRAANALRAYLDRVAWSRPRLRRDGWSRDETKLAWGALAPVVRAADEAAGAEILAALRDPTTMRRPAVVSALVHHREMVEALRRLERVTPLLAALAARGDEPARQAAAGVRLMVDAHLDDAQRAWAVRQLARFEDQWLLYGELAPGPRPDDRLSDEARRLQAAWLSAWADGEPADEAEALAPAAQLLALHADAALLADSPDHLAIARWAGLAGAGPSIRAEAARCEQQWGAIVGRFFTERDAQRAAVAAEAAADWSAVLAAAAIERTLRVVWAESAGLGGAPDLAIPPSARAWLATRRDDLGALARWSIELEHAEQREDAGRAEDIRAYLAPACARLAQEAGEPSTGAMLPP